MGFKKHNPGCKCCGPTSPPTTCQEELVEDWLFSGDNGPWDANFEPMRDWGRKGLTPRLIVENDNSLTYRVGTDISPSANSPTVESKVLARKIDCPLKWLRVQHVTRFLNVTNSTGFFSFYYPFTREIWRVEWNTPTPGFQKISEFLTQPFGTFISRPLPPSTDFVRYLFTMQNIGGTQVEWKIFSDLDELMTGTAFLDNTFQESAQAIYNGRYNPPPTAETNIIKSKTWFIRFSDV